MQFSSVLYIFLIAMIVMLLFHEKLKNKYGYFFLIIGMMTSFFDLLTYPVATFGIPIILFFILENKSLGPNEVGDIKKPIHHAFNDDYMTATLLKYATDTITNNWMRESINNSNGINLHNLFMKMHN